MSAASGSGGVGLIYTGNYSKEPDLTIVQPNGGGTFFVCRKENNNRKRIVAEVENQIVAEILRSALE
jgi:hypothetical protein